MSRVVVLLWAAVLFGQQDELTNPRTSPEDVVQGEKTFRSHCSPCHGFKGDGGRGPNLSTGVFYHGSTDSELLGNISNGIAGTEMPGLFYSPDRVWQVIAYVRSLSAASLAVSESGVAEGAILFQKQGCCNCHRVNGVGGRMGPDLSNIGATRAPEHLRQAIVDPNADVRPRYWVIRATTAEGRRYEGELMNQDTYTVQFIDTSEQLHSLEKAGLKAFEIDMTSKMPSFRDKLSAGQVGQLVAWLSSLRRVEGAK